VPARCPSAPLARHRSYSDNTATAQTIGALQREAGAGTPLRAVVTVNYDTSSGGEPNPSDVSMLFGQGHGPLPQPTAHVFGAAYSSVQWHAVQGTRWVRAAEVSTHTVDNPAFGVQAGSPIQLLLLMAAGPIPLTIGISTELSDYELLGAFAADAAKPAVAELVSDWLART
jgi:hypothetical protein